MPMSDFPNVEYCWKYIVFDNMTWEECAREMLDDISDYDDNETPDKNTVKDLAQTIRDEFKAYCKSNGTTINEFIKNWRKSPGVSV